MGNERRKRFEPMGLIKWQEDHGYEFCCAWYAGPTDDGEFDISLILYFRNASLNIYGLIDYAKIEMTTSVRAMAAKVIEDTQFRDRFIVDPHDDEILTANWK